MRELEPPLVKGWKRPTLGILEWRDLTQEARDYIDFIEQEIEAPVTLVSTHLRREETIARSHPDLERLTAGRLGRVWRSGEVGQLKPRASRLPLAAQELEELPFGH